MIWRWIRLSALLLGALASPAPSSQRTTNTDGESCLIDRSGRSANCVGRQYEHIPWRQFPSTLEEIDLSYNKLQAVRVDDFLRLPQLHTLKLQYNNISHIDKDAFKNNTLLEHLNIFNNSLEEIPAAALSTLLNLKKLYMSNNPYKSATLAHSFSKCVKLKVLSMGGPLVMGLKKADFQPLKNIKLQEFAIKCSSDLSFYEPGSLEVIQTRDMGFDMAIDQLPRALPFMLQDIANKTFRAIQFRNIFEFMYYMEDEDIFKGLKDITAQQLVFHRGKFNEHLLSMALMNLQDAPIKRLRLQYIDFARSPTFVDSGAGSSITDLALDKLELWYISNPDILRFDWRFTWFNKVKELSIQHVYFNFVPCDAWVEMEVVEILDASNNRLNNYFLFNKQCDYRGAAPHLHTFNMSRNVLTSLRDLSMLTKEFKQLQVLDFSYNQMGSAETSQDCVWQINITRIIAHHNPIVSDALQCLPTTVQYLDLSYCDLDQLDMMYFEKATNLKELLLSGNKIKYIPYWVREQLLPSLENNKNPYRLCIHERDFMPGKWIIDNIIDNIESSRKVIFILSRHFVNSEWCNYELYFTQQRAMGKTFGDVILVMMEPMDASSIPSKYCRLKKMLSTKTYLEWPQQVNLQAFFWAQLRSVLGKPTMTREERHSVRSRTLSVGEVSVIGPPIEDTRPEGATPNADKEAVPKDEIIQRNNCELSNQRQIPLVAL
ncbi:hypothetical protein CgunFtcFv8_019021 [Champsocephalus gunnari]|uniref:TIR domain-containing protein n=1 Tax=Champsocephalus gunnari TaxID=52237 RepID=A0AAN8DF89_CHAGU|nr:hypothetical protein CgunFtcFv8_019021 [Champsocephalus gunnari]